MNDLPPVVEYLKKLAREYHDTHQALEARRQDAPSKDEFLAELKQREAALISRFRIVQKQLFGSLEDEALAKALELSRIFDQIRIINEFALQTLAETSSVRAENNC
jgi:hypothetical protein